MQTFHFLALSLGRGSRPRDPLGDLAVPGGEAPFGTS